MTTQHTSGRFRAVIAAIAFAIISPVVAGVYWVSDKEIGQSAMIWQALKKVSTIFVDPLEGYIVEIIAHAEKRGLKDAAGELRQRLPYYVMVTRPSRVDADVAADVGEVARIAGAMLYTDDAKAKTSLETVKQILDKAKFSQDFLIAATGKTGIEITPDTVAAFIRKNGDAQGLVGLGSKGVTGVRSEMIRIRGMYPSPNDPSVLAVLSKLAAEVQKIELGNQAELGGEKPLVSNEAGRRTAISAAYDEIVALWQKAAKENSDAGIDPHERTYAHVRKAYEELVKNGQPPGYRKMTDGILPRAQADSIAAIKLIGSNSVASK